METPLRIKVIECPEQHGWFSNIATHSKHDVVPPPEELESKYPNSKTSVWVMGKGRPVRLLPGEFEIVC
jgi:hypothetical protein